MSETKDLLAKAQAVLKTNSRGDYTVPAPKLYPHQWLWDSCFIAIGLAWSEPDRAAAELERLVHAQWSNGMIPNMVFNDRDRTDHLMWNCHLNPDSPIEYETSGITQPPMMAEAVWRVSRRMKGLKKRAFLLTMVPKIIAYHEWLYTERDPKNEGLVSIIHPWESGLDNSPAWSSVLSSKKLPYWIRTIDFLPLDSIINKIRNDTRYIPSSQRSTTLETLSFAYLQRRLRSRKYDGNLIMKRSKRFRVQDVGFNSILIRANRILEKLALEIDLDIDVDTVKNFRLAERALQGLWSEKDKRFYSRVYGTKKLIDSPSISSLLPIYSGAITDLQVKQIVSEIKSGAFSTPYPLPSLPPTAFGYSPERYWRGPVWINTNWLVYQGLMIYDQKTLAEQIKQTSINLCADQGFYEYFNPETGQGIGASEFSWTAALAIDFVMAN
jgi:Glycosyl hydrolase family 63 C-terminal domain